MTLRRDTIPRLDRLISVPTIRPVVGGDGLLRYDGYLRNYYWTQDPAPGKYDLQHDLLYLGADADGHLPPESVAVGTPVTLTWGTYVINASVTAWRGGYPQWRVDLDATPNAQHATGALTVAGLGAEREIANVTDWAERRDFQRPRHAGSERKPTGECRTHAVRSAGRNAGRRARRRANFHG